VHQAHSKSFHILAHRIPITPKKSRVLLSFLTETKAQRKKVTSSSYSWKWQSWGLNPGLRVQAFPHADNWSLPLVHTDDGWKVGSPCQWQGPKELMKKALQSQESTDLWSWLLVKIDYCFAQWSFGLIYSLAKPCQYFSLSFSLDVHPWVLSTETAGAEQNEVSLFTNFLPSQVWIQISSCLRLPLHYGLASGRLWKQGQTKALGLCVYLHTASSSASILPGDCARGRKFRGLE
jgi:hypothetical protein